MDSSSDSEDDFRTNKQCRLCRIRFKSEPHFLRHHLAHVQLPKVVCYRLPEESNPPVLKKRKIDDTDKLLLSANPSLNNQLLKLPEIRLTRLEDVNVSKEIERKKTNEDVIDLSDYEESEKVSSPKPKKFRPENLMDSIFKFSGRKKSNANKELEKSKVREQNKEVSKKNTPAVVLIDSSSDESSDEMETISKECGQINRNKQASDNHSAESISINGSKTLSNTSNSIDKNDHLNKNVEAAENPKSVSTNTPKHIKDLDSSKPINTANTFQNENSDDNRKNLNNNWLPTSLNSSIGSSKPNHQYNQSKENVENLEIRSKTIPYNGQKPQKGLNIQKQLNTTQNVPPTKTLTNTDISRNNNTNNQNNHLKENAGNLKEQPKTKSNNGKKMFEIFNSPKRLSNGNKAISKTNQQSKDNLILTKIKSNHYWVQNLNETQNPSNNSDSETEQASSSSSSNITQTTSTAKTIDQQNKGPVQSQKEVSKPTTPNWNAEFFKNDSSVSSISAIIASCIEDTQNNPNSLLPKPNRFSDEFKKYAQLAKERGVSTKTNNNSEILKPTSNSSKTVIKTVTVKKSQNLPRILPKPVPVQNPTNSTEMNNLNLDDQKTKSSKPVIKTIAVKNANNSQRILPKPAPIKKPMNSSSEMTNLNLNDQKNKSSKPVIKTITVKNANVLPRIALKPLPTPKTTNSTLEIVNLNLDMIESPNVSPIKKSSPAEEPVRPRPTIRLAPIKNLLAPNVNQFHLKESPPSKTNSILINETDDEEEAIVSTTVNKSTQRSPGKNKITTAINHIVQKAQQKSKTKNSNKKKVIVPTKPVNTFVQSPQKKSTPPVIIIPEDQPNSTNQVSNVGVLFKCPAEGCQLLYPSVSDLVAHYQKCIKRNVSKKWTNRKCKSCLTVIHSLDELITHLNECSGVNHIL